jgi:hypothetical protein
LRDLARRSRNKLTSREGRRRSSGGVRGSPNALGSLKRKARSKLGIREKEMLANIKESIRYSNKIVSGLLEYSRELRQN